MRNDAFVQTPMRFAALLCLTMVGCPLADAAYGISRAVENARLHKLPSVLVSSPRLLRAPTQAQLAAFYCAQKGKAAERGCGAAIGQPPAFAELAFQFGMTLTIQNRREAQLPLAALRVLLTIADEDKREAVGTICLRMCSPEDRSCTGAAAPGDCSSPELPVLRAAPIVASAVPGLIAGPTTSTAAIELCRSEVAPGETIKLELVFDLGINQMLEALQPALQQRMHQNSPPGSASLSLPVSLSGAVFVWPPDPDVRTQRKGVWFGPVPGVFTL